MKLKVLIVANNLLGWSTWQEKINNIHAFFYPTFDLDIDLKNVSFPMVPFVPVPGAFRQVDPTWYDAYITPLGVGYDILVFAIDKSLWPLEITDPTMCLHGWETGGHNFIVTTETRADENMVAGGRPGEIPSCYNAFEHMIEHELMHALFYEAYNTNGVNDTTHVWDYTKLDLAGAIGDMPLTFTTIQQKETIGQTIVVLCNQVITLLQGLLVKK